MKKNEQRKKEMLKMKKVGKTNVYIGNHFGISGERVRQIIGNFGYLKVERIEITCPICNKIFKDYLFSKRRYCNKRCSAISRRLIPEKKISEYTKKEKQVLSKTRNDKWREKRCLYYQRPNVKQRRKKYQKTEKYKEYQREYQKTRKYKEYRRKIYKENIRKQKNIKIPERIQKRVIN